GAVGGHHYATFYAAGALGDEEMERITDVLQNIRGGRHTALYGDDEELEPGDLERARAHVSALLQAARRWLISARPALGNLPPPPG
ncbi:MAG TPA: hypothetical protein VF771_03255, partial [Longimicrobiaceae bacterium]